MPKAGMTKIGTDKLKQLFWGTQLKPNQIAEACGVSEASYFKWQRSGVIPLLALEKVILLNRFSGYQIRTAPRFKINDEEKQLDFEIVDFFGAKDSLYAEVKTSSDGLEGARTQLNAFAVPVVLVYLNEDQVIVENNRAMDRKLASGSSTTSQSKPKDESLGDLKSVSLDTLLAEIERRGWAVKLERQPPRAKAKSKAKK